MAGAAAQPRAAIPLICTFFFLVLAVQVYRNIVGLIKPTSVRGRGQILPTALFCRIILPHRRERYALTAAQFFGSSSIAADGLDLVVYSSWFFFFQSSNFDLFTQRAGICKVLLGFAAPKGVPQ